MVTGIPEEIEFDRPKKYRAVKILGKGACGVTLQIHDEDMNVDFVCKKFLPIISKDENPELHSELLNRFKEESRILFRVHHPNIVRVYNYYDYGEQGTAYIIMELVSGLNIIDFLKANPEKSGHVFEGVISGFSYLEDIGILHRDIRPENILIDENGGPRVIDFGFGRITSGESVTREKSIDLNWWCELPKEFESGTYDICTEIYFIGKLFEKAIFEIGLADFPHKEVVRRMCIHNPAQRPQSFQAVQSEIAGTDLIQAEFSDQEISDYRAFADCIMALFSTIEAYSKYNRDQSEILEGLKDIYEKNMLESLLPNPVVISRVFVSGSFRYWRNCDFPVSTLKNFISLLDKNSHEKRAIILNNLFSRIDSIERTDPPRVGDIDDEIPF